MRLRNKPWAEDFINSHPEIVIPNPEEQKGKWNLVFDNENPLHIEVGTGKGQFVTGMAKQNPDINYIGIELYDSVIVSALENALEAQPLPNLRLLKVNGADLAKYFQKNDVHRVYLNFSDPWPKDRHAKRRLTSTRFLERYDNILTPEGRVMFKTDNKDLFDFSLEQVEEAGWILENHTYDLHHSEYNEGNVMTEYEEKFSAKGNPICRLVAYRHAK